MKVLIATGSSGGHIFPALALIEVLRERGIDTLLVLPERARNILPDGIRGEPWVRYIATLNISFKFNWENIVAAAKFMQGAFQSLLILFRFKPDVAVGFGTLDCLAVVFLARFFRIKTLIHEQNVIPGKANKLLAKFADKTAVSFAQTAGYLNIDKDKITVTGNPLRKGVKEIDRDEALSFFGFNRGGVTVLVMGGSSGSSSVNAGFLSALPSLALLPKLQVIHISGEKDYEELKNSYSRLQVRIRLFPFLREIEYAYSASDFALCRSGATTIAELIRFRLPAIILPYPFAYNHQLANARVLESAGVAVLIEDRLLNAGAIREKLELLTGSSGKLKDMRLAYGKFPESSAAEALADAVLSVAG